MLPFRPRNPLRTRWAVAHRLTLILVLGAGLALGCPLGGEAAKVKIRAHIVDYNEEGRQYYQNVVVPQFQAEHPDVEVELEFSGWSEHVEKLSTWFAAGVAPDAIQIGAEDLGYVVEGQIALPLDRYVAGWAPLKDFPQPVLVDGQAAGHQYTVAFRLDQRTLIYRRDLFAQVGLNPDRAPATWEELAEAARRLTRRDAQNRITQAGFTVSANFQLFAPLLFQAGGRILTDDLQHPAFHLQPGVDALRFLVDLMHTYRVTLTDGFMSGRTAMAYEGDWVMRSGAGTTPFANEDVGVALPMRRARQATSIHVNKWIIVRSSKNPDAAWRWIEFVSRPEVMAGIARANSHLPPRLAVSRFDPWAGDVRWQNFFRAAQLSVPYQAQQSQLSHIAYTLIVEALNAALNQEKPAKEALEEAARRAEALLHEKAMRIGS